MGPPSSLKISLPPAYSPPPRSSHRPLIPRAFILLLSLAYTIYMLLPAPTLNFAHLATSVQCPGLEGISRDEFGGRQGRLASLLTRESGEGFGVYVSEPGPNTLYYVNISSTDWSLSERPFLLILTPSSSTTSQLSILVPKFELSRAQSLSIALGGLGEGEEERWINWVTWDEADDPYMVLIEHLEGLREREGDQGRGGWSIGLEENVRTFVGEGIRSVVGKRRSWDERQDERVEVRVGLVGIEVRELRMRKTEAELRILRCVAKVTLEALKTVRGMLHVGMTEKEGETLIATALISAGLTELGIIVLFGANAALPHASAGDKRLERGEFVLMDVDGSLLGYQSDLTRTMLPDVASSCGRRVVGGERRWPSERSEKVWRTVSRAQHAALESLEREQGVVVKAKDVDWAARSVIEAEGWGQYFSHRLGHGIGLQVHEHPYLNAGNDEPLREGETFSNEPGIYIERSRDDGRGGIGVRLEDMVHLTATGWELLTGSDLARDPWNP